MKDKLSSLRKRGPMREPELDPAVEADLEMDMDMGSEDMESEDMGPEEEQSMGGSADQVISMLAGLSPSDLDLVQEELDNLMAEGPAMDEESDGMDMDYEDVADEEESLA